MTKTLHTLPTDLRKAIAVVPKAQAVWDVVTPLAKNKWICWAGCPHR